MSLVDKSIFLFSAPSDPGGGRSCQTFAAERCKLLLITSTQISSIHPQDGPSLRTRIVIISRHVRSRGVDELKMLLLMPQKFNIPTLKIRCLLET